MTFRLPWVSRFAFESVTAELRRQIAEQKEKLEAAEKERQLLIDVLAENGIGSPIYRRPEPATPKVIDAQPTQDIPENDLEWAVRKTGSRNPRAIVKAIESRKEQDFEKAAKQALAEQSLLTAIREGEKRADANAQKTAQA